MPAVAFGCEILEVIHRGPRSTVSRARRRRDGAPVIVKAASDDGPRRGRVHELKHEADLLGSLRDAKGVVALHELARDGDRWALILQDVGHPSLDQHALAGAMRVGPLVDLALRLVDLLEEVHSRRVVHNDFDPTNLLYDPTSGRVTLVDFASARVLPPGAASLPALGTLNRRLSYLSPEQTGRIRRPVDYRSDYYSLGVTLFELLTGVLPFQSKDPLELVHAHVARPPPSPGDLKAGVPAALSAIVLKLLSKETEARYQSPGGLRRDLERCRDLPASGGAPEFAIGQEDRPRRLRLPRRVYGRGAEIERLTGAFDRAARGASGLAEVSGPAGIGKSTLVREVARAVGARRGYFASGKFEQYETHTPYGAVAQVIDSLVEQLLTESSDALGAWRATILASVTTLGPVLVDLCPTLEMVIGSQPPASSLSGADARARLHEAVGGLFGSIAAHRPICAFFDDVQWASPESLDLLRELVCSRRDAPLLVVVAYRDPEAGGGDGLREILADVRRRGVPVEPVALGPLAPEHIGHLLSDAFRIPPAEAAPMAEVVHAKTGGNPFFARAFLAAVMADGAAEGGPGSRPNLERIRLHGVTDNVVDLLVQHISRLPAPTQAALRCAACLGNQFDLPTLRLVAEETTSADLAPAIAADLVLPVASLPGLDAELSAADASAFRFAHDRVQQAVLAALDDGARRELHLRIGRRLRDASPAEKEPQRLFAVVHHLSEGLALIDDPEERACLAGLALVAAQEALLRAAGSDALGLVRAGLAALGAEAFARCYDLARDLHLAGAEAAFAVADHDAVRSFSAAVVAHARAPLDVARVRRIEGQVQHARLQVVEAIATYRDALERLGVALPERPSPAELAEEMRVTAEALRGREIDALLDLPECRDPAMRTAMDLLSKLIFFTYTITSDLLPIAICRLVRATLEHGSTPESANAYTFYGVLLTRDQDLDRAHRFGRLAIDLAHRYGDRAILSQTYLFAHYQALHWKMPFADLAASFRRALEYSLEAGGPFNAAGSAVTLDICRFWAGDELAGLARDMEAHRQLIARLRQQVQLNWHEVLLQAIHNLRSGAANADVLAGPVYDERVRVPIHEAAGDHSALFNYYVAKALLLYLLGDAAAALPLMDQARAFLGVFGLSFWAVPFAYLDSLCAVAAAAGADPAKRASLTARLRRNAERLSAWLPHNRPSLEHKLLLVEAELASARGDLSNAARLFAEAVELALEHGALFEQGIACEQAARFSLATANSTAARQYLRTAHRAFARWGATTKVRALERQYAGLLPWTTGSISSGPAGGAADSPLDPLDHLSVLSAWRTIAGEIRLERLLERFMSLVIENAGAQLGYLLLKKNGAWVIEAGQSVRRGTLTIRQSVPIDGLADARCEPLATSVVHYVARTGEAVILDGEHEAGPFAQDPHLLECGAASVLCFPLKRQGEILAIAYLENSLVRGAFNVEGLRILELLSTQAVVSLENATLYESLERKVEARTLELQEKNKELGLALARVLDMQQQLVAQEKLAALGTLTAGIAHEIKNPLNFITNFADIAARLAEEIAAQIGPQIARLEPATARNVLELVADLQQVMGRVRDHGVRAGTIINAMALHAGQSSGQYELTNFNRVVDHSVSLAAHGKHLDGALDVQVITEYDREVGDVELVVPDVARIFVNLINNAHYAMQQKRLRLGVSYKGVLRVTTRSRGDRVEACVRDNGVGVPAALREKIFTPFFTTKPSGQGTGLGLSISHDIARGHGGEIRVESVEGEFSAFTLSVPRRQGASTGGRREAGAPALSGEGRRPTGFEP